MGGKRRPKIVHFFVEGTRDLFHIARMPKKDCTDILKALADKSRMRIVKTLISEPYSVNDLAEKLDISQYNVSKHLRVLREAGIVDVQPDGTRREYFVVEEFHERLKKEGDTLDFGCCSFRFDQLPD